MTDCDCYKSLFFVHNIETSISTNISNYSSSTSTVDYCASLTSQVLSSKLMGLAGGDI